MFVFLLFVTLMAVDALILQRFSVLSSRGGISFQNIRHCERPANWSSSDAKYQVLLLGRIHMFYLFMFFLTPLQLWPLLIFNYTKFVRAVAVVHNIFGTARFYGSFGLVWSNFDQQN